MNYKKVMIKFISFLLVISLTLVHGDEEYLKVHDLIEKNDRLLETLKQNLMKDNYDYDPSSSETIKVKNKSNVTRKRTKVTSLPITVEEIDENGVTITEPTTLDSDETTPGMTVKETARKNNFYERFPGSPSTQKTRKTIKGIPRRQLKNTNEHGNNKKSGRSKVSNLNQRQRNFPFSLTTKRFKFLRLRRMDYRRKISEDVVIVTTKKGRLPRIELSKSRRQYKKY